MKHDYISWSNGATHFLKFMLSIIFFEYTFTFIELASFYTFYIFHKNKKIQNKLLA